MILIFILPRFVAATIVVWTQVLSERPLGGYWRHRWHRADIRGPEEEGRTNCAQSMQGEEAYSLMPHWLLKCFSTSWERVLVPREVFQAKFRMVRATLTHGQGSCPSRCRSARTCMAWI